MSRVDFMDENITLEVGTTKNGGGRIIYLTKEFFTLLRYQRLLRDEKYPQCQLVFTMDGRPFQDFRKAWRNSCRKSGLEGKLFHDLRRTAVRNMIRAGVAEVVAMRVSGHKTRSIFDRYNIVNEADLCTAARRVEAFHDEARNRAAGVATGTKWAQLPNLAPSDQDRHLA
jgi:integrase